MFIRIKKNKSGSLTVILATGSRVAGKKHPVSRIIKSFGTTTDKKILKELIKKAEAYKQQLEATSPKAKTLKITSDLDFKSCRSYNVGFKDVYGKMFDDVFSEINIKNLDKLKELAVMRIASPASKLRTADIADKYGIELNVDSIYKFMDKLTLPTIKAIKQTVYNKTNSLLLQNNQELDVLFYDLTTIYFETGTQDEIRDFGFSKDGKHQHVQIMLAAIVTKEGLPVDYEEFAGNCYEGHTLIPVINKIRKHYNIDKVVLVADAALMNKINLKELDSRGIKYVISARLKNTKAEVKKTILNKDGYQEICSNEEIIKAKVFDSGDGDSIISYHSSKRARKDEYEREKNIEKAKKHIGSTAKSKLTSSLKKTYITVKGCSIDIDYSKLELEKQFDGFFGLRTNIKDANPLEMLISYRGLWQVEHVFRVAKNNLEIRPVYHYRTRRIRAHFIICYIALALIRYVNFTLKYKSKEISYEQLYLLLDRMRTIQIIDCNNELFEFIEDPPPQLFSIYQTLNIEWRKKFRSKGKV